jgi:hypothetical protein
MNINSALLSIVLLSTTSLFCQARLGETDTKCDVRYNPEGKRSEPSDHDKKNPLNVGVSLDTTTYNYQGWNIRIGFQGGFARCMEYSKPTSVRPSGNEIDAILKANELGGTWHYVPFAQTKTNAVLGELWKYTGNNEYSSSGYWLRSDYSIAYFPLGNFGSKLRLVHKKVVDIGVKQMREREAAKKEPVPKF